MSDSIKHECGIALLRLLKPLDYYEKKYGTWQYGINKLYLLMEKQHNRGQDGAGALSVKLNSSPGKKFINRKRSATVTPIIDCFNQIFSSISEKIKPIPQNLEKEEKYKWIEDNVPFSGNVLLGHLRYGTFGKNDVELVHPFIRTSNWKTKTLTLAGNFNLTNVDELFQYLIQYGQHPREYSDTITALELIGLHLDEENEVLFRKYKNEQYSNIEINTKIEENVSIANILRKATQNWDGGYVMGGVIGHGDAFVLRDPWGIRPAYYYYDDEIFVATSERPVIQTTFNISEKDIHEINPGEALIIKRSGLIKKEQIRVAEEKQACSFEKIYFSRGTDSKINLERKKLGELLAKDVLKTINYDFENTVFSFIPNTAELAFYGILKGIEDHLNNHKKNIIIQNKDNLSEAELEKILALRARVEKIAVKDAKMRTFISQDSERKNLVGHIYDITYGTIRKDIDTLVIIDDSIVRGTTLKESIITILDRLHPKKIIVVSSAPLIKYPDCYGIDMAKIGDFIAFQAAIEVLKDKKMEHIIKETYELCKTQQYLPKESITNYVSNIYKNVSDKEICNKIAKLIKASYVKAEIEVIFQSVENLHIACPDNAGDWYFTGKYPTDGGNKVVNTSFINYYENRNERAY